LALKTGSNQSGFALLLILAPILVSCFVVTGGASIYLHKHKQHLGQCRMFSQDIQRSLALGMAELTALNPKAQHLRRKKEHYLSLLKYTYPEPLEKSYIVAQLSRITAQQKILALKQKHLISKSKRASQKILEATRQQGFRSFPGSIKFSLYPWPPNSLAPEYKIPVQFSRLQTLKLEWSGSIQNLLPVGLAQSLPMVKTMKIPCATTIVNRRDQWPVIPVFSN
jgi:hypothetical protein